MPQSKKLFQIFRTGKHVDSKGRSKTWTTKDLDNMVKSYNESGHEAPLVIGHPKTDNPAYGWVDKLVRKGGKLFAEPKGVIAEFAEAQNKGMFKKRSPSFYPSGLLKHVGFLGAVPPAIKGMENFQFAEGEDEENIETYEFSEDDISDFADYETAYALNDAGRIFRNIKNLFIEKFGLETAEKTISEYSIDELQRIKGKSEASLQSNFNETPKTEGSPMTTEEQTEMNGLKDEVKALKAQSNEFSEKATAAESRATAAEGKLQENADAEETAEVASFCEELIEAGKLTPALRPQTESLLLAVKKTAATADFSEGEEKKSVSAYDALKAQFSAAPEVVNFSEVATKNNAPAEASKASIDAPNKMEVDEDDAREFSEAKKLQSSEEITFEEALVRVRAK